MTELLGKNYIRKNTKTYLEEHFGQKVADPVEILVQLEEDCDVPVQIPVSSWFAVADMVVSCKTGFQRNRPKLLK